MPLIKVSKSWEFNGKPHQDGTMNCDSLKIGTLPCTRCRTLIAADAITCPNCGWIRARNAFAAIRPDTLSETEHTAFTQGYQDCQDRWKDALAKSAQRQSGIDTAKPLVPRQGERIRLTLELPKDNTPLHPGDLINEGYCPVRPYENAYRAGWEQAVEEILTRQSKTQARRKGLFRLNVGATFLAMALTGYGLFQFIGFTRAVLLYWLLAALFLFLPLLRLLYVRFARQQPFFNWHSLWNTGLIGAGMFLTMRLESWVMEYILVGAGIIFVVIGAVGAGFMLLGLLMLATGEGDE